MPQLGSEAEAAAAVGTDLMVTIDLIKIKHRSLVTAQLSARLHLCSPVIIILIMALAENT